jgi:hypothetical protein
MKKLTIMLMIIISLSLLLFGCAPKTGEAQFTFSKEFEEESTNNYKLGVEYYGETINFRDYVKVNDDTNWVLSKKEDGSSPISTFKVTLGVGDNNYYVVCSDRLGISNAYKINLNVEGRVKYFFFIDYDVEAMYDYAHTSWINNSTIRNLYYDQFGAYHYTITWEQIENHSIPGNSQFYEEITGIETESEKAYPTSNPQKAGYNFDGWSAIKVSNRLNGEPIGVPKYYLDNKSEGQYQYKAFVAKWK